MNQSVVVACYQVNSLAIVGIITVEQLNNSIERGFSVFSPLGCKVFPTVHLAIHAQWQLLLSIARIGCSTIHAATTNGLVKLTESVKMIVVCTVVHLQHKTQII